MTEYWHRSSSCESGSCLEVATCPSTVKVRDSKDPEGPVLEFTHGEWQAFPDGIRNGEFDL